MKSSILDIAALIKPLGKSKPTGKDLRGDVELGSLYQRIRDERSAARALERQQLQAGEIINAKKQWQQVYQLAIEILVKFSKDLEVAVWLTEALLREHGFAGLKEGFQLIAELLNQYWDNLYPLPEPDEGAESRLQSLIGLNGEENVGTLIVPMAMVTLTQGNGYALWQYQQALDINKIADEEKRQQRISAGGIALLDITSAASATSSSFFQKLLEDLKACEQQLEHIASHITKRITDYSFSFSRIHAQLRESQNCIEAVMSYSPVKSQSVQLIKEVETNDQSNLINEDTLSAAINITHRDHALSILLAIADFFKETEPHSPLSYMLERAVRWGRLPLPDLLKELIIDPQAYTSVYQLTGIQIHK